MDKTGLPPDVPYEFRFDFDFTPEGVADIFEATETQLGLKLVPEKAPVEFVVVDRIARPSPN